MYVCICNAVTDGDIREAYAEGACTLEALQDELGVATCCGRCEPTAREVLARCQAADKPALPQAPVEAAPLPATAFAS